MPNIYAARKRLRVGDEWREIGDLVPEAASWRNLHSYLSSGAVVLIQTDVQKAYGMNQRIPLDDQLDVRTARVGATHHDQTAGWGEAPPEGSNELPGEGDGELPEEEEQGRDKPGRGPKAESAPAARKVRVRKTTEDQS